MSNLEERVAAIQPDTRKRFTLGKFITREPVKEWSVYRSADGKMILLKAVTE